MGRLLFDDLLVFSRKAVLAAIYKALEQAGSRPAAQDGDKAVRPSGLLAVDATAGNGVDTEFLAQAVEKTGLVLAFDVQEEALRHTRERLDKFGVSERVRLIQDSHERIDAYLGCAATGGAKVTAAMYNLGFLPGSASPLVTQPAGTIASLNRLQPFMAEGSAISIHCYSGHAKGQEESAAVEAWVSALHWPEWRVLHYEFCNKSSNREKLFLLNRL